MPLVAPYTGAWIETILASTQKGRCRSLPTRGRGLKQVRTVQNTWETATVAPYTGAWIETIFRPFYSSPVSVAPYTGAWIETESDVRGYISDGRSLPTRGRGLKPQCSLSFSRLNKSLPTRGRGLKLSFRW